jgi:acetyl-CoA C-acetyltransferase
VGGCRGSPVVTAPPVFLLGGHQTDFARNVAREGGSLVDLVVEGVRGALEATDVAPGEVQAAHVGNFMAELTCYQGHLGAFTLEADPALRGIPTARHEAACASGSIAALAAAAEIEAGRYDLVCVLGVEMERNIPGDEASAHLGVAAWHAKECQGVKYPWPRLFSDLGDVYAERFGLSREHLAAIAQKNFANAKRNPLAQTRAWRFDADSFGEDDARNPVIEGRIRRQDCSQVTDGAAALLLASERYAEGWARRSGLALESVPRLLGWGHHTAPMLFGDKMEESKGGPYVFPHVRRTIDDAFARAGLGDVSGIDAIETHDCFTTTEYMAIDHFGITLPGESWRAIEAGETALGGRIPVNPGGGLMGIGHPVGATGVRMLLDAWKQTTGNAGDTQVAGARRVATLNIGGSGTTSVSFVVGR